LAAWSELNDRQRGVLAVVYELDQLAEAAHRGLAPLASTTDDQRRSGGQSTRSP
jgi:hypothetical protein